MGNDVRDQVSIESGPESEPSPEETASETEPGDREPTESS